MVIHQQSLSSLATPKIFNVAGCKAVTAMFVSVGATSASYIYFEGSLDGTSYAEVQTEFLPAGNSSKLFKVNILPLQTLRLTYNGAGSSSVAIVGI